MTDTPKKLVVDIESGTEVYVDMTAEEIAQLEIDTQAAQERKEAKEAELTALEALKTSARAKLVAGQALTEEEAAVITL